MKYFLMAAAVIVTILLAVLLYGGYYVFCSVFDNRFKTKDDGEEIIPDSEKDLMRPTSERLTRYQQPLIEKFNQLALKELEITSFDGLKLKGYLLEGNPEEVVICVHGYKSSMYWDFCDKIQIYQQRGSTVLFLNDRAHGNSEGRYRGFSELDRFDVANWVDKINEIYDDPKIYLHGVSMGGATVIHCANMKLRNVCGIIDDCGFNSILDISRHLIEGMYNIPYFPVGYIAWFWSKLINNVDFNTSVGEECVRNTDIPILFFHGREDYYVPCYMSENMHEACVSPKELHLIDGCGHAAAYMCSEKEYTEAVNRLMDGEIK